MTSSFRARRPAVGVGPRGVALVVGCLALASPGLGQGAPAHRSEERSAALTLEVEHLVADGNFAAAAEKQGELAAIYRRELASEPGWEAAALSYQAALFAQVGEHARAKAPLERSAELFAQVFPPDSPHLIVAFDGARNVNMFLQHGDEAWKWELRSMEVVRRMGGDDAWLQRLAESGEVWSRYGDPARAGELYGQAVAVLEGREPSTDLVQALTLLARSRQEAGLLEDAEPLFERALAEGEALASTTDVDRAVLLNNLAEIRRARARYAEAQPLYDQAVAAVDGEPPVAPMELATFLNNRGLNEKAQARFSDAEVSLRRAIALHEEWDEEVDTLDLAYPLNNLAELLRELARYDEAEPLYRQSLAIRVRRIGAQTPVVATTQQNLGLLYFEMGRDHDAEPLLREALATFRAVLGSEHPQVANTLHNLGSFLRRRGQYEEALALHRQALGIQERVFGGEHPQIGLAHGTLALVLFDAGAPREDVRREFEQAHRIFKAVYGADHPETGRMAVNLILTDLELGKVARARAALQRERGKLERSLGPNHPLVTACLQGLGHAALSQGRLKEAARWFKEALDRRVAAVGPHDPGVFESSTALAIAATSMGDQDLAEVAVASAVEAADGYSRSALLVGGVAERSGAASLLRGLVDVTMSAVLAFPSSEKLAWWAFWAPVLRQGRELSLASSQLSWLAVRDDREVKDALANLRAARAELARVAVQSPDAVGPYETKTRDAERALFRFARGDLQLSGGPSLEQVVGALEEGDVLLSYVRYTPPFRAEGGGDEPTRYAAMTLRPGYRITLQDLGTAESLDAVLVAARADLSRPDGDDRKAGRRLHHHLLAPVEDELVGASRVFLVADGLIQLVPLAAALDGKNRLLLDRVELVHLASARDVVRPPSRAPRWRGPPLVVGDPAFGEPRPSAEEGAPSSARASRLVRGTFARLPGARREAALVRWMLGQADLLGDTAATETALRRRSSPSILHLATHGFFFAGVEPPPPVWTGTRGFVSLGGGPSGGGGAAPAVGPGLVEVQDPLLRTGLAFAGANLDPQGADDGILTALEVADLDLQGTELVVLSACDTGVGDIKTGEGVYGLRRALALAGSETQVLSLWAVDDVATQRLMVHLYGGLLRGKGRATALRDAQRKLARSPEYAHPFFWAAFVQSGAWGPLTSVAPRAARRPASAPRP